MNNGTLRKAEIKRRLEKWAPLLEGVTKPAMRRNLAVVLENEEDFYSSQSDSIFAEQSGTASVDGGEGTTGIGRIRKIVIPMVRRVFPGLIANDLVGVQPMAGPTGLAFAYRRYYEGGEEIGYQNIDSGYSGPNQTYDGERMESAIHPGSSGRIREISGQICRTEIYAKTRKLKARYSLEAQQDLSNMHGMDIDEELSETLSYETSAEVDREILYYITQNAMFGGVLNWTYDVTLNARWSQEAFRTLYTTLLQASNQIAQATMIGPGNWIVASTNVCTILESLENFMASAVDETIDTAIPQTATKVGTIGRFVVYRDVYATEEYCVVGRKGAKESDSGIIYCPYIPIMFMRSMTEESFQPIIGVMTRYAIADHLFGAPNYYRYITISGLTNSPLSTTTSGVSGALGADNYTTSCTVPASSTYTEPTLPDAQVTPNLSV